MNRRQSIQTMLAGALTFPGGAWSSPIGRGMAEMSPYTLDFGADLIADLHGRIDRVRWADVAWDTGWEAGTSDAVLRELVRYWRVEYDWLAVQAELNQLEHLRGPIRGELLHCVRLRNRAGVQTLPLLLIHGWPSSFVEFLAAGRRLAGGEAGMFDVIIPSLPGFALSEAPHAPGVGYDEIAQRLHLMMLDLGYDRYGVQGGDWGSLIATQIARRYPEHVAGLHLNFVASAPPPPAGTDPSADEVTYREYRERFASEETGYSSIQGTRPQTLAYAQADSPVGWLAWILEKYSAWGDTRGDLWGTFDRDDLLTTAMLYWLPNRILSAARIYYETRQQRGIPAGRVEVPTSYARFPQEPWSPPPEVVSRTYNLVRYTTFDRGGHFPALERPIEWSADVAAFFSAV